MTDTNLPQQISQLAFYWLPSPILGGLQRVWVHSPPKHFAKDKPRPWLLLLGGVDWQAHTSVSKKLAIWQQAGYLSQLIFICLDGPKAPCCPLYAAYLQRELIPWLQEQFNAASLGDAVIAGAAIQATSALYMALKCPQQFCTAIAISPDLAWSPAHSPSPGWLMQRFAALPKLPLYIALYIAQDEGGGDLASIDEFCAFLTQKNYHFACQIQRHCDGDIFWLNSLMSALDGSIGHFLESSSVDF